MTVARYQNENTGANPFVIEGPIVLGSGIPASNFTLGSVVPGDAGAEWVYCKLTLASTTTITTGAFFIWDQDYNASLMTTANASNGLNVGVFSGGSISPTQVGVQSAPSLAAGVYYIWIQRCGMAPFNVNTANVGSTNNVGESTSTAGQANFPSSPTATTKGFQFASILATPTTFTANTVNGSAVLTGLVGASSWSNLFVGTVLTGTSVAGLSVVSFTQDASGNVTSITMSGNASATGSAITMTPSKVIQGSLGWPQVFKTN